MAKPGFSRRDQPSRHLSPTRTGQSAKDKRQLLRPWQRQAAGKKLMPTRQIEERRQHVTLLHIARGHKLGKMKKLDRRMVTIRYLCVYIGDHTVSGAQVNANDITRRSSHK